MKKEQTTWENLLDYVFIIEVHFYYTDNFLLQSYLKQCFCKRSITFES